MDRELRRFPRIAAQYAVLVKRLDQEELETLVKTRTLGLGGCGFLTDNPLGVSSLIELLISVRHEVIRAKAKVVYEIAAEEGKCEVGAAFVELADADRDRIQQLFES